MICLDFDWEIDEFLVYCRSVQLRTKIIAPCPSSDGGPNHGLVNCFYSKKEATACLDEDGGPWYNTHEKSITDKRSAQETTLQGYPRSRHLPEWRLPRFTVIVMVKLPICTVNVIGMVLTPFCRSVADRLSRYGNALPGPERDRGYFIREWGKCQFYLGI